MAEILQRSMGLREVGAGGVTRILESVAGGGVMRVFFGAGTAPAALAPDGAPGAALPQELRAVAGALLGVFAGEGPVALAAGGSLPLDPAPEETGFLAGRNCLLGFRLEESPAQVAEGLIYHALHHGAGGAVILNRLPGPFAAALAAELEGIALRVVVLDIPGPVGRPGAPPENHPIAAPDAPGRERMERPAPDPWRAAPAEPLLLEAVKWRFLAQARAVLVLDVTDILDWPVAGAAGAFDLCQQAPRGVIALAGRRIYPWRVRKDAEARFGDHICRPFDRGEGLLRWGCAPQKAGLDNTWRMLRVAYARAAAEAPVRFLRAMAIRVPGRAPSELAPKTSLVEDAGLMHLATRVFGWKPVQPPVSRPRSPSPGPGGRTAIVTTMKNEAPFILEWLAWHRAIGVQDFLVYTNDCTDGTDRMLDLLAARGIVQHRDNPYRQSGLKPQHAALQAAEAEAVIRNCDWAICMDVDEFINIRLGDGRLPTLHAAMEEALPGANMIALTWRLFGNSGIHAYEDRFVVEQFTRCAPEVVRKPHQAWGFKTLFRNIEIYRKLGVHRPKGLNPDLWEQVRWLNGSGRPMPQSMFRNGWRSTTATYGYDWVQLNHYAVRSVESFLVKRDRGRVNHVDRDQGLNYWFRMNHNAAEDRSIQARLPMLAAEWARLMADPEIAEAHAAAVAAHRARIAELMAAEDYRRLHAELTGARMERLCRMQAHFGSAVFSAGPGVIPPDLHLREDLPADFFFTVDPPAEAAH